MREGMHAAVLVEWTESEAGWGLSPDGVSLHLSKDDAEEYIKAHWAKMPSRDENGSPPKVYERPERGRTLVMIDNELHRELHRELSEKPEKALRLWDQEFMDLRKKKRVVTQHDM